MKAKFVLLTLFFSIKIWACKCNGEPNLKNSFENADFVFIGNIYGVNEVPSGFKTSKNILSSVKIEKIYKSNYYDGFYKSDATLYGSSLRSCDILFTQKGKYLIFAYYDEDTGFLYSDNCFYTKKLNEISENELKVLDNFSQKFYTELKIQNAKELTPEKLENLDIFIELPTPTRKINKLNKEINEIKSENKNLKITLGFLSFLCLILGVFIIKIKKNCR